MEAYSASTLPCLDRACGAVFPDMNNWSLSGNLTTAPHRTVPYGVAKMVLIGFSPGGVERATRGSSTGGSQGS